MRRILIVLILILLVPKDVYASERLKASLKTCIDGDTVVLVSKKKEIKVRFLAIDTPELSSDNEEEKYYANKAKEFTCNKLKNASNIEIEYDEKSNKTDKYGRELVWIFYDNKLLQNELIKKCYAKRDYVYGDYEYLDKREKSEEKAKEKKVGIYGSNNTKFADESFIDNVKKLINKYIKKISADVSKFLSEILDEIF